MSAHTPAPWAIIVDVPGAAVGYRAIVKNDDGQPGDVICNPSPMGEADARLIAAAPELLAALSAMLSAAELDVLDDTSNVWRSLMLNAHAAIQRANGAT